MNDAEVRLAELRRLTSAQREAEVAEQKAATLHREARARRREAEQAVARWLSADAEPCPLFDGAGATPDVARATPDVARQDVTPDVTPGEEHEDAEQVFAEPVLWNVFDAYRRKDAGEVEARSYSEAKRLAHGHYPEVPEGACLVTRAKEAPAPWTGAAAAPDAWRHQGVGLALRTLSVPTVKKLGQAGLATVGQLQDWFLANPGKSIDGLGSKSTAAVEDALVKYLDSRPVPGAGASIQQQGGEE